jgi:hypothetical protein
LLVLFQHLHGVVGASVVNGIYPEISIGSRQNTVERAVHIKPNVIAGEDAIGNVVVALNQDIGNL